MSGYYTVETPHQRPIIVRSFFDECDALRGHSTDEALADYEQWCYDGDIPDAGRYDSESIWEYAAHDLSCFWRGDETEARERAKISDREGRALARLIKSEDAQ